KFIEADDDDDDLDEQDLPAFTPQGVVPGTADKGKGRAPEHAPAPAGNISSTPAVSGNIGSSNGSNKPNRQTVGGIRVETRYSGEDTLDEPITATIMRDLLSIYTKLAQVLYPRRANSREVLRDWDLWGPLLLCLALGIMLSISWYIHICQAPASQSLGVFSTVVAIVSLGSLVVTMQSKLLGGRVSFFQGLCVLGYCIAPLDIAALVACFVRTIWIRAPIAIAAWAWCIWASVSFLDGAKIEQQRVLLAVYPLLASTAPPHLQAMPLRIGYVREHFCSPLLQYEADDQGKTFTLVECPSGTGQLISRLTNDEIDVAIGDRKRFQSLQARGELRQLPVKMACLPYPLLDHWTTTYATSPWRRAVITGYNSSYQQIPDLQGTTLGISRYGSGSHTMAYVMALQQGWPTDELKFQVNNDIRGLLDSVNEGSTSAFMWEWFTTKPFADASECRFIGAVPTPWPSWLIAAHPERASTEELKAFLSSLTRYVQEFQKPESRAGPSVEFIKRVFGYPEEDVKAWLQTVEYTTDCAQIDSEVISRTLSVLQKAGAVTLQEGGNLEPSQFVNVDVARLVSPNET
ncbi:hypothetical protein ID866_4682, partial [Astraeus odoratus]